MAFSARNKQIGSEEDLRSRYFPGLLFLSSSSEFVIIADELWLLSLTPQT